MKISAVSFLTQKQPLVTKIPSIALLSVTSVEINGKIYEKEEVHRDLLLVSQKPDGLVV